VLTSLKSPRGLTALPGGDLLVPQAGTGTILRVSPDGTSKVIIGGFPVSTTAASGPLETIGAAAIAPDSVGGYYVVVGGPDQPGFDALYNVSAGAVRNIVADLGDYEAEHNTDGYKDAQGTPELLSNPFDVAADELGRAYVTDSSANAVIRYTLSGGTNTFFVFPDIANPRYPKLGAATIHQAPTGVTIGPDKAIYVATFTGYPYPQGEARVYRLEDKNMDGDAQDIGEATIYATGLTAATDVAFDDKDRMLVSEYSTDVIAKQPGRISRIVNGTPTTIVHLLTGPTGLAFTEGDRLLVTEGSIGRVTDVTDAPGGGFSTPITAGVTLATYKGGSVAQLEAEALGAGASAVSTSVGGKLVVLVPGAPTFVNKAFTALYPGGVPTGTSFLIVGK